MAPLKPLPKGLHISRSTGLVWQGLAVSLKKLYSFAQPNPAKCPNTEKKIIFPFGWKADMVRHQCLYIFREGYTLCWVDLRYLLPLLTEGNVLHTEDVTAKFQPILKKNPSWVKTDMVVWELQKQRASSGHVCTNPKELDTFSTSF